MKAKDRGKFSAVKFSFVQRLTSKSGFFYFKVSCNFTLIPLGGKSLSQIWWIFLGIKLGAFLLKAGLDNELKGRGAVFPSDKERHNVYLVKLEICVISAEVEFLGITLNNGRLILKILFLTASSMMIVKDASAS